MTTAGLRPLMDMFMIKTNKFFISAVILVVAVLGQPAYGAGRIYNGSAWRDTDGNAINAHGGGMYYENGYYYWFGENRRGMRSYGVSVYRSEDLMNWESLGLALTPTGDKKNTLQDIAEGRTIERPKVIKCEKTGKYVMWAHWEDGNDYSKARVMIAQADKVEGPYSLVRTLRPNGAESRDQTVFVDSDGTGYHFSSSEDNMTMHLAVLSDDYLIPTENWTRIFAGKQYEAPAIMKINGTYIGFFSGCTGWRPNPGHVATTRNLMGEWNDLGNPCVDANAETTYTSQPTYALKVEGYDYAYMYMGDRWNSSNVETSTYVWFPVMLRTGVPFLRWFDSWNPSMFETLDAIRRAESISDGNTYVLLSRMADRIVSLNDNKLCLLDDDDARMLNFVFEATGESDTYKLRRDGGDDYLTASSSGVSLQPGDDTVSQKWVLERQSDNFYIVSSPKDGKILSVRDASMANGAELELIPRTGASKAKFGVYFDSRRFDYPENSPWGERNSSGVENVLNDRPSMPLISYEDGKLIVRVEDMTSASRQPIAVTLYDLGGRVVAVDSVMAVDGTAVLEYPSCRSGMYIVKAVGNGQSVSMKIALSK